MTALAHSQIRTATVDDLLYAWHSQVAQNPREGLVWDLRASGPIERVAGAVIANALLTSLGECRLTVILPDTPVDWLPASGLAFAIANRPGPKEVLAVGETDIDFEAWQRSWAPGSGHGPSRPDALFPPTMVGETALWPNVDGASFAAFVDPHLASPGSSENHPLAECLWPWLDRLLPKARGGPDPGDARRRFIVDVGHLVSETVLNVREHAGQGERVRSLVQVSVTRGGGARSFNRLYLVVQDNGVGIPRTARAKIEPTLRAQLDDHQLVYKLLDASLPPWGRARGFGLPKVLSICKERGGTFYVATKTTRARWEGRQLTAGSGFGLDGTVIALMLPVPTP